MTNRVRTFLASLPLLALFVLHNDFWAWRDARLIFGLPVGLTYHVLLTLAASAALLVLVRVGWPRHLVGMVDEEKASPGRTPSDRETKKGAH